MRLGYCPKCNTQIKDYGNSKDYGGDRGCPFKCKKCGFEGEELYHEGLAGFIDNNGKEVVAFETTELISAAQEVISNLEDANETTDDTGQEFRDITRLKKAVAEMNGEEEVKT